MLSRFQKNLPSLISRRPGFLFTEILLTYRCPQSCLQCSIPDQAENIKAMTFNDFKNIIDRLDSYGTHGIILSGGEPLLHTRLFEFMDYISGKNFSYLHILSTLYGTNSNIKTFIHKILEHRISLTCSFDGFDGVADHLRGAKNVSDILIDNIEYLDDENKKLGNPIKTSANIVISQINIHQIPEILRYFEKLGWMVNVDLYRSYSKNGNDPLKIANISDLSELLDEIKSFKSVKTPHWILDGYIDFMNNDFPKLCPYLDAPVTGSKFFVQPNGDVKVCKNTVIGNLLNQQPGELVNSERWQEQIKLFEACTGCWNTCYTLSSKLSNYFNLRELRNVFDVLKN